MKSLAVAGIVAGVILFALAVSLGVNWILLAIFNFVTPEGWHVFNFWQFYGLFFLIEAVGGAFRSWGNRGDERS